MREKEGGEERSGGQVKEEGGGKGRTGEVRDGTREGETSLFLLSPQPPPHCSSQQLSCCSSPALSAVLVIT